MTAELAEALGERHPDVTALVAHREAASRALTSLQEAYAATDYGGPRPR